MAVCSGVPATTLRFYEKGRLLPAARTASGYRAYTDSYVDRVRLISAAKHLGLSLDRIRDLLSVWDGGMCREIRDELRPMVATQMSAAADITVKPPVDVDGALVGVAVTMYAPRSGAV